MLAEIYAKYLSPLATKVIMRKGKFIAEGFVIVEEIYRWRKKAETYDFSILANFAIGCGLVFFCMQTNYLYPGATKAISAQK